jgi:cellulose biosynthesis protein BcsQ
MIDNNNKIKSIAITSSKGGTGKSIISASLAYALSHLGYKTLLIDTDVFTGGITFYLLADYQIKINSCMQDILLKENQEKLTSKSIEPIKIPSPFCNDNLYLLPSIAGSNKSKPELFLFSKIYGPKQVLEILRSIIDIYMENRFDYIIIDTRGGTDYLSICSALAANGYIFVTEADKTSWDTGKMLFDTIEQYKDDKHDSSCLGFIINKNVLPSEAIETFLKKEWGIPHIATIPLDIDTVKYFQQDKIPFVESLDNALSLGIIKITDRLIHIGKTKEEIITRFMYMKSMALKAENKKSSLIKKINNMSRMLEIMQFCLTIIIVSLITTSLSNKSFNSGVLIFIGVVTGVLLLIDILSLFFKGRLQIMKKYLDTHM